MTTTLGTPAAAATRGGGRALIAMLAVTQTVGYGVLVYAFSVLLTPIAADLNTSTATVTGAITLSILTAAAAAIPIGRRLDRHGGRLLMTAGSILGVAAVLAWSQVDSVWQLYAVFALIGLAVAASLYEAAFPVVVATVGPHRRDRALLTVTIVAGFASSIFFPLTGWLLAQHGWRSTLVWLAAILAVTAIPGHSLLVPAKRTHQVATSARTGVNVRQALRDNKFWLLAVAFVAQAAAVSAVGVLLVAFLLHAGHSAAIAATVSGLLGVLSVTGRVLSTGLSRRFGMTKVTAAIFAVQAIGAAVLPHAAGSLLWAAICVTAFGLGFGVATIARPAILADRYGTGRYATIAAAMSVPVTLAKAAGPLAGAALGIHNFLTPAALACLLAAVLLAATTRTTRANSSAYRECT